MSIDAWRTLGIIFAAVGQTFFVALYATFPWWKKFLGRALFFKAVAFALLVDIAVFGRVWDWAHEEETFIVLYWLLGFGVWAQAIAFLVVRIRRGQDAAVSGNGVTYE